METCIISSFIPLLYHLDMPLSIRRPIIVVSEITFIKGLSLLQASLGVNKLILNDVCKVLPDRLLSCLLMG